MASPGFSSSRNVRLNETGGQDDGQGNSEKGGYQAIRAAPMRQITDWIQEGLGGYTSYTQQFLWRLWGY